MATPHPQITALVIPFVQIENDRLDVGSLETSSVRSWTPIKMLGDGVFGTVWLCDWHGTLPLNTPISAMQCAKPEWATKHLVAVKRMKRRWEAGWDDYQKLKEIESMHAIPPHPNTVPLYDAFLLPDSLELYFVFEPMEGNLYHLIKARKGRPLAGGLVSSIFHQILSGLDHIHSSGYFHRDVKPENILVTTTGLFDYVSVSPIAPPNAPLERDVVTIVKLGDFGSAQKMESRPLYTEYVCCRWYRAPEVLLLGRDYSSPVDMWAVGTIMAELINLQPLFPGTDQVDQVAKICDILGDPSDQYYPVGGGPWQKGIKAARNLGFQFPKMVPKDIFCLFNKTVRQSLVLCIRDLLKYDPDARLTARQCLEHPYFLGTAPRDTFLENRNNISTASSPPSERRAVSDKTRHEQAQNQILAGAVKEDIEWVADTECLEKQATLNEANETVVPSAGYCDWQADNRLKEGGNFDYGSDRRERTGLRRRRPVFV